MTKTIKATAKADIHIVRSTEDGMPEWFPISTNEELIGQVVFDETAERKGKEPARFVYLNIEEYYYSLYEPDFNFEYIP